MLSICAISDLHGYLPEIKDCELILICGDIVPLEVQDYSRGCYEWYRRVFKPWAESLPCNKVLFIAGNHEVGMEGYEYAYKRLFPLDNKVSFLFHEEFVHTSLDGEKYKIFGTPYCKIFGNWAYMCKDEELVKKFYEIPEKLDILITHDAPFGVSDVLLQKECRWATGEHIGNKPLADAILKKSPSIVCHGHLHSSSRDFETLGSSKVINCSIKDEFYNPIYSPLYFSMLNNTELKNRMSQITYNSGSISI